MFSFFFFVLVPTIEFNHILNSFMISYRPCILHGRIRGLDVTLESDVQATIQLNVGEDAAALLTLGQIFPLLRV